MKTAEALIIVVTTVPDREEGERLASTLVAERLAACVQLEPIRSIYRWQGQVETAAEFRLTAKSTVALQEALMARIEALHRYDVPEIIAMPVSAASQAYGGWIRAETG